MRESQQYAQLRTWLSRPPSRCGWAHITAILEDVQNTEDLDVLNAAIHYTAQHLTSWPRELRIANIALWWPSFPEGIPGPLWTLARRCDVPPGVFLRQPKPFKQMLFDNFHHMKQITHLGLAHQGFNVEELRSLQESPHTQQLHSLNLASNRFAADATGILSDFDVPALHTLAIGGNHISRALRHIMGRAAYLPQLQTLFLDHARISDTELTWITRSESLSSLRHLFLDANQIGTPGMRYLAESPYLRELKTLSLTHNKLNAEDIRLLLDGPLFGRLRRLCIAPLDVSPEEKRRIRRALEEHERCQSGELYVDLLDEP